MHRPLDEQSRAYAAEDITKIRTLHQLFVRNPLFKLDLAIKQSESYTKLHAAARPDPDDKYMRHGLLPLMGTRSCLLRNPTSV